MSCVNIQKILRYVGIALDDKEEAQLKQLATEFMAKMFIEQEANSLQTSMLTALDEESLKSSMMWQH